VLNREMPSSTEAGTAGTAHPVSCRRTASRARGRGRSEAAGDGAGEDSAEDAPDPEQSEHLIGPTRRHRDLPTTPSPAVIDATAHATSTAGPLLPTAT
jgi:hypothetical protein